MGDHGANENYPEMKQKLLDIQAKENERILEEQAQASRNRYGLRTETQEKTDIDNRLRGQQKARKQTLLKSSAPGDEADMFNEQMITHNDQMKKHYPLNHGTEHIKRKEEIFDNLHKGLDINYLKEKWAEIIGLYDWGRYTSFIILYYSMNELQTDFKNMCITKKQTELETYWGNLQGILNENFPNFHWEIQHLKQACKIYTKAGGRSRNRCRSKNNNRNRRRSKNNSRSRSRSNIRSKNNTKNKSRSKNLNKSRSKIRSKRTSKSNR
jgi:hypothetical protein